MKRFILFITSLLQIIIVSHASIFHTETFEFSKLNQDTIVINGNRSTLLNYQNLQNTTEIGAPSIPVKHLIFSVPWNASNITINYLASGLEEIQLHAPISSVIPTVSDPYEVNYKNSESVQSFDKSAVLVSNNLLYGINRIIGIDVFPVTLYDDNDLKAIFASKIDLTISWNLEDTGFLSENSYKPGDNKINTQPKMVVKDRAWWYNLEKSDGTPCNLNSDWHSEFGIQIGDEVEINGTMWHELNVVKRGDGNYYHGMIIEDEYPICISYIREENNNVYALFDYDLLAEYPPLLKVMQAGRWAGFISKEPEEVQIYHFGTEGQSYLMGSASGFADCAILSTYEKHFDYDQLECPDTETDHIVANVTLNEAGFMEEYSGFTVVEGIGAYTTDKEHMSLFFAPFTDNTAESEFAVPVLRFVTPDADLNQTHVIFQAAGGYRQWNILVSAPTIEADSDGQSEFWYGIDGIRVTAPLVPGIYIRVAGGVASKVIVK